MHRSRDGGIRYDDRLLFMVEKELDYRFVKAVSQPVHDGSAYYLLSDSPFTHDPRKTVFKQWLQAEFRKTCEKAANKT